MFVYVKYDDELDTSICTKIKDSFAKCVHCSGPHPASYRESTVYQEILNRKNVNFHNLTNKTSKTTLNTAAPQPIRSFPNLEGSRRSKFATTCANAINSHKSNGDHQDPNDIVEIIQNSILRMKVLILKQSEIISVLTDLFTTLMSKLLL